MNIIFGGIIYENFVIEFIPMLLIPVLIITFGVFMLKCPPRDINSFVGYRTSMSTKNKDTWDFAQKVCGKLWWKIGLIMFLLTLIIEALLMQFNGEIFNKAGAAIWIIQLIVLIGSIFPVEKALNRTFNKDGSRK